MINRPEVAPIKLLWNVRRQWNSGRHMSRAISEIWVEGLRSQREWPGPMSEEVAG